MSVLFLLKLHTDPNPDNKTVTKHQLVSVIVKIIEPQVCSHLPIDLIVAYEHSERIEYGR